MDNKELLNQMVQDFINGKEEQSATTLHTYMVNKMRDVAGLKPDAEVQPEQE